MKNLLNLLLLLIPFSVFVKVNAQETSLPFLRKHLMNVRVSPAANIEFSNEFRIRNNQSIQVSAGIGTGFVFFPLVFKPYRNTRFNAKHSPHPLIYWAPSITAEYRYYTKVKSNKNDWESGSNSGNYISIKARTFFKSLITTDYEKEIREMPPNHKLGIVYGCQREMGKNHKWIFDFQLGPAAYFNSYEVKPVSYGLMVNLRFGYNVYWK